MLHCVSLYGGVSENRAILIVNKARTEIVNFAFSWTDLFIQCTGWLMINSSRDFAQCLFSVGI